MLTDIKPSHYFIDIVMDENDDFQYYNGSSSIHFRANVNTNFMAFHFKLSNYIAVHDISLVKLETLEVMTNFNVAYFEDGSDPLIAIESHDSQFLKKDEFYQLDLTYTVRFMTGQRDGFYKVCAETNGIEKNCFATTHFEVYNIRFSFPSFDNSTLKAHFNIKVKHRSDMMALSNMPGHVIEDDGFIATTEFDESPLMATYLVAIAVGRFNKTPIENLSNISMNFYTPVGIGERSTLLEKYAGQFLYALESYLDMRFALPKLDFFASRTAPDYIQGMELWGLISFDGNSILDRNGLPDVYETENSIKVIAHEMVHQFFGNLVSLKDLNSMWLKEGITTYFTSRISADVFPHENYKERMFLIDYGIAMQYDSTIEPGLILNNFGVLNEAVNDHLMEIQVTYTKGSVFTNMICHILGETTFQKFIRNIMEKFGYDSISNVDFINELKLANEIDRRISEDVDIAAFVDSWINQPKYPILNVNRNYQSGEIIMTQNVLHNTSWWIPFNYATNLNPNFDVTTADGWLKNESWMSIVLPELTSNDWIVFNKEASGYYVVNYDERNWNLIADALMSSPIGYQTIPTISRAKLFLDVLVLHRKTLVSDQVLYRMLRTLKHEYSYITFEVVTSYMVGMEYLETNADQLLERFYEYSCSGAKQIENTTRVGRIAHSKGMEIACRFKYKKCLQDVENYAIEIVRHENSLDEIYLERRLFGVICNDGIKNDERFTEFLKKVNLSRNKEIQTMFHDSLEEKVKLPAFQKYFLISFYNLPSISSDIRLDPDLLDVTYFNELTILNDCFVNECYDFVKAFKNKTKRLNAIYSLVIKVLMSMEAPKLLLPGVTYATVYDLLNIIEIKYGAELVERIKLNYDINKPKLGISYV